MLVYNDIRTAFYKVNHNLLFSGEKKAIVHKYFQEFFVKPEMGKGFNFTNMANYTSVKWDGLLSNYLDFSSFQEFDKKVGKRLGKSHWAETMKFSHNTIARQACLISATAMNDGERNYLSVHVRTSEVYKRLSMDLLLFKRIGDIVFAEHEYLIHVNINHTWLSSDWASMLLTNNTLLIRIFY